MNLLDGLVDIGLRLRGREPFYASTAEALKTILANQRKLMEDFDTLSSKVTTLGNKVDTMTQNATDTKAQLVDIRADIGALKEIIAGAGPGGLNPQQTAALGELVDGVDSKANAALEAMAAAAADAASVAGIVT